MMSDPAPAPAPGVTPPAVPNPAPPPAAGGGAMPEWLSQLPEDLRGDATLSRFATPEELARGHVEAHKLAKAKSAVAHDVAVDNFDVFAASRPPEAAAYDVTIPEGYSPEYADWFRGTAHKVGLHPAQAKALAEANNEFMAAEQQRQQEAVAAFKTQYNQGGGDYDAMLATTHDMLKEMGMDGAIDGLNAFEAVTKSAPALEFLFGLAKRFGEPPMPGGGAAAHGGGALPRSAADATATRKEKLKDPEFVAKAKVAGTAEHKLYQQLIQIEASGA